MSRDCKFAVHWFGRIFHDKYSWKNGQSGACMTPAVGACDVLQLPRAYCTGAHISAHFKAFCALDKRREKWRATLSRSERGRICYRSSTLRARPALSSRIMRRLRWHSCHSPTWHLRNAHSVLQVLEEHRDQSYRRMSRVTWTQVTAASESGNELE